MATIEQYRELKTKAEQAQAKADRAAGRVDQLRAELKREFGCDDVGAATKLLEKLRKEAEITEAEFDKAVAEFKEKWAGYLGV